MGFIDLTRATEHLEQALETEAEHWDQSGAFERGYWTALEWVRQNHALEEPEVPVSKAFRLWYMRYVRTWLEPGQDPLTGYPPPYIEVANRAWEAGAKWRANE